MLSRRTPVATQPKWSSQYGNGSPAALTRRSDAVASAGSATRAVGAPAASVAASATVSPA